MMFDNTGNIRTTSFATELKMGSGSIGGKPLTRTGAMAGYVKTFGLRGKPADCAAPTGHMGYMMQDTNRSGK